MAVCGFAGYRFRLRSRPHRLRKNRQLPTRRRSETVYTFQSEPVAGNASDLVRPLFARWTRSIPGARRRTQRPYTPFPLFLTFAATETRDACFCNAARLNFGMARSEIDAARQHRISRIHAMKTTAPIRTITLAMSVVLATATGFAQTTNSLTFTAVQGQFSTSQSVQITMKPNCPSCTILMNQVPSWLMINPVSPMGSTTISIIANANNLTPGSYSASVNLNMGGNPNITVTPSILNVTFVVTSSNVPFCSQQDLSIVSAGSYGSPVAPGSLVSIFGTNISLGVYTASDESPAVLPTTLGGVSATITDYASGSTLPISLFAVTTGQVNALLPSGSQSGTAIVNLTTSSGAKICGIATLNAVGPSLFTADQTGGWLAAAQVVIVHSDGSQTFMDAVAQYSSSLVFNGSTWSQFNTHSNQSWIKHRHCGTGIIWHRRSWS